MSNKKQIRAIEILKEKYDTLGRLPKKTDFAESVLGPLPRAFEAAGLKDISPMYLEKLKRREERKKRRHYHKNKEKKNAG